MSRIASRDARSGRAARAVRRRCWHGLRRLRARRALRAPAGGRRRRAAARRDRPPLRLVVARRGARRDRRTGSTSRTRSARSSGTPSPRYLPSASPVNRVAVRAESDDAARRGRAARRSRPAGRRARRRPRRAPARPTAPGPLYDRERVDELPDLPRRDRSTRWSHADGRAARHRHRRRSASLARLRPLDRLCWTASDVAPATSSASSSALARLRVPRSTCSSAGRSCDRQRHRADRRSTSSS